MDDLAGPSFFDFASTTHTSLTSNLDLQGSALDPVIKHDAFDSTAWIQGCHDPTGMDSHVYSSMTYQQTQVMKSNEFLHNPHLHQGNASLESLMTMPTDPLEMILNQPKIDPLRNNPPLPVSSNGTTLNNQAQSAASCSGFDVTSMQPDIYTFPAAVAQDINLPIKAASAIDVATESSSTVPVSQDVSTIAASEVKEQVPPKEIDPKKDLNLYITNVVSSFRVRCHLNLRRIAQEGINVIFQKESKKIVMRMRNPPSTAYIWSSGKIVCTGANSEVAAKKAARKCAKRLQTIGFRVMFSNFKVINVLAVCKMPYHINIVDFSNYHRSKYLSYEPELHPAVTYRVPEWKVTFKIFSTGSITLTCPVVARIPEAVKHVYPMVKQFFRYEKPNDLSIRRKSSNDLEDEEEYESS